MVGDFVKPGGRGGIGEGGWTSNIVIKIILLVWVTTIVYPMYYIIVASLSDPSVLYEGRIFLAPQGLSLDGYKKIFSYQDIWRGYRNSAIYLLLGTAINLVVTLPAAYALSRKEMKGRKVILIFFTMTIFIRAGLIPTYLVVSNLSLINTVWVMVLINAVIVWNLIISRTFYQGFPEELYESAMMDGCSDFRIYLQIVMPTTRTLIMVMFLYYSVLHWNSSFPGLIYLTDQGRYPIQVVLSFILARNQIPMEMVDNSVTLDKQLQIYEMLKYCLIIAGSLPILLLIPFVQKFFLRGVMLGSIKG